MDEAWLKNLNGAATYHGEPIKDELQNQLWDEMLVQQVGYCVCERVNGLACCFDIFLRRTLATVTVTIAAHRIALATAEAVLRSARCLLVESVAALALGAEGGCC